MSGLAYGFVYIISEAVPYGEEALIASVRWLFSLIIKGSLCHLLDVHTISPDSD